MSEDRLDLEAIEALYEPWPDVTTPMLIAYYRQVPALVAELREHRKAIEALGAVYATPSGPMDAVQQVVLYIKELEKPRSDETIWAIKRVLELEEEVAGLKAVIKGLEAEVEDWGLLW